MSAMKIEIRRVGPEDHFMLSEVPAGMPFAPRWVATTWIPGWGRRHFFGWTRKRALAKCDRYLRAIADADATREIL